MRPVEAADRVARRLAALGSQVLERDGPARPRAAGDCRRRGTLARSVTSSSTSGSYTVGRSRPHRHDPRVEKRATYAAAPHARAI